MSEEAPVQATAEAPAEAPAEAAPAPAPAEAVSQLSAEAPVESAPAAEPEQPADPVPESYADFTTDDGQHTIAAEDVPEFAATAKELGLSQDKARKVLMSLVPAFKGRFEKNLAAVQETWAQEARRDPEFGGDRYESSMKLANAAYRRWATPELAKLMNAAGLTRHPDFIRLFYRIGRSMSQDTGVAGQGSPQPKRPHFPNSNMVI